MEWVTIENLIKQAQHPLADELLEASNGNKEPYYRFMYLLAQMMKPKLCVEIGTEHGVGAYHLAKSGCPTIAVDPNAPYHKDKFTFVHGKSIDDSVADKIRGYVDAYGPIGILYQDSSHHYAESHREWEIYSEMMADDAIWICDDVSEAFHDPLIDPPGKSMVNYFVEIPAGNKRLYRDCLHKGGTQGIILL